MNPTIVITVDPAGNARVDTTGFHGPACREASRFVEIALGRRTGEALTAEFHEEQAVDRRVEQSL